MRSPPTGCSPRPRDSDARRAVLAFLAKERAITDELRAKMLGWRYCGGFSAHNQVRVGNREGRMKLAG